MFACDEWLLDAVLCSAGNIDAVFEKRRRERMMAKKKEAAEKKHGRAAFKAKLEAQNPKPA